MKTPAPLCLRKRWVFMLTLAALLGASGCSTISSTVDKINPFSSSAPKVKPAELVAIKPSAELTKLWQAGIGNASEFVFTPAVVGNSVYVAAKDGTLARFDEGRQVWKISAGQTISGGVGASDKLVVVGTAKGAVLAFHAADGRPAWTARASSEILAAPAVSGDLVAIRSGDARIFGFEATDGKRRWVYQRSTPTLALRSPVGVTLTEGALYAGFPGGKLVAVALNNGAALWESAVALPRGVTELERIADVASEPVVEGGSVCAVAYQGRVVCFDASNGALQWARDVSSINGLDIGNRALYVTDEKDAVHAFDRGSGASLWKQDKLALRGVSRPLVVGRHIAVADFQGVVHLLSATDGAFAARLTTDGSAVVAPPRRIGGADDRFVVQTKNGAVHALAIK
ncbi:MAG: outer membrane protein assembly factor BamB [Rhodocyclaceae bacterium]|nr:outer membrane protein assembly factor BamB [Rhodocyclaceae bacterium]